jgi:hypothetical protein
MNMAAEPTNPTEIQVDDREIARLNALHAHKSKEKQIEMGLIGKLFGSVAEKPGNIAGLIMIAFCLMFGGVLMWGNDAPSLSKKDELVLIGGFISLTLGFIFGRSTS